MADPGSSPHLLLVAGAGGLSPLDALRSAATVTRRISVLRLAAWGHAEPSAARALHGRDLDGEWVDVPDVESAVTAARALHGRCPLDGSVTHSEMLLGVQGRINQALGLRGNRPQVLRIAQSKWLQRRAMAAAGLPVPAFHVVRDAGDLAAAAEHVGFPAVLKPVLGAGSLGVVRVDSATDLHAAFATASAAPSPFLERTATFVLERLLTGAPPAPGDGDYCSVESVVSDGRVHHLAVVDRLPLRHGFVEEGAVYPSALPAGLREAVEACATACIEAVGLTDGAAHTEIKLTPDGPVCIEVNARLGGPVGHILREASDNDIAATIARVALGLPFRGTAEPTGAACFRSVPAPPGRHEVVAATPADDLLARHDGLVYVRYRAPVGGVLDGTFPHSVSLLVRGRDRADALARAAAVEADLGLRLAPLDDERTAERVPARG